MSTEALFGSDVVAAWCPLCEAGVEVLHTVRYVPVAGRWRALGRDSWVIRCVNGHAGEGETPTEAMRALQRNYPG